jgi:hypothetical protein
MDFGFSSISSKLFGSAGISILGLTNSCSAFEQLVEKLATRIIRSEEVIILLLVFI